MTNTLFDHTLGEWLELWANKVPEKDFIVYPDRNLRFTWAEFNSRVNTLANGLLTLGVTRGTHVGIWAQNVPDWLSYMFACAKIGAVSITVNTNYKAHELALLS